MSRVGINAGHKLKCNIEYSVCKFYTAANTTSIYSLKTVLIGDIWHSVFHWLVMVVSVQIMIVDSFVSLMYAGIMLIERPLECMHGSLWKNCSLCVSDWILCSLKKFLLLHKVSGLDNSVLKMCYLFYCQSTEFVCMCHEFDIALDIRTTRDIRHKISAYFNCVVLNIK